MKKQKSRQILHQKYREPDLLDSICSRFMSMDSILRRLSSMKDNAESFNCEPDADPIWQANIDVCEAATSIITALQDEGISDPEQVRDLVQDYNAQAKQYQTMHQKYEVPVRPKNLGGVWLCPDCNRQMCPGNNYCWNCGKRLGW